MHVTQFHIILTFTAWRYLVVVIDKIYNNNNAYISSTLQHTVQTTGGNMPFPGGCTSGLQNGDTVGIPPLQMKDKDSGQTFSSPVVGVSVGSQAVEQQTVS